MSGPKTAKYRISAEARDTARKEAARRRQEHLARLRSVVEKCDELESECERLRAFAQSLKAQYPSESFDLDFSPGTRPDSSNLDKLTQYAASTQKVLDKSKQQLSARAAQANINKQFRNGLRSAVNCLDGDPRRVSETAKIFADRINAPPPDEGKARASQCNRIIARLYNQAILPVELQILASKYINASNAQRANALESELRLKVKNLNASWENQKHDQETAKELLIMLDAVGVEESSELRQQLQRVSCGFGSMSGELQTKAKEAEKKALAEDADEEGRTRNQEGSVDRSPSDAAVGMAEAQIADID